MLSRSILVSNAFIRNDDKCRRSYVNNLRRDWVDLGINVYGMRVSRTSVSNSFILHGGASDS